MSAIDFDKEAEKRFNHYEATGGSAEGGLTVLDYFAGKALEGLMQVYWDETQKQYPNAQELITCHVETAYEYAEAMLAERNKRFTPQGTVKGVTGKTYG